MWNEMGWGAGVLLASVLGAVLFGCGGEEPSTLILNATVLRRQPSS